MISGMDLIYVIIMIFLKELVVANGIHYSNHYLSFVMLIGTSYTWLVKQNQ